MSIETLKVGDVMSVRELIPQLNGRKLWVETSCTSSIGNMYIPFDMNELDFFGINEVEITYLIEGLNSVHVKLLK